MFTFANNTGVLTCTVNRPLMKLTLDASDTLWTFKWQLFSNYDAFLPRKRHQDKNISKTQNIGIGGMASSWYQRQYQITTSFQ